MQVKIDVKAIDLAASRLHDHLSCLFRSGAYHSNQRIESCRFQGEQFCRDASASNQTGIRVQ